MSWLHFLFLTHGLYDDATEEATHERGAMAPHARSDEAGPRARDVPRRPLSWSVTPAARERVAAAARPRVTRRAAKKRDS